MKFNLKLAIVILIVQVFALNAVAQRGNAAFTGVWELTTLTSNDEPPRRVAPGYIKIFGADLSFSNMQVHQSGSVISHRGMYTVNDHEYYTESVMEEHEGMFYALAGHLFKIKYLFSEDKKTLTLTGAVQGREGRPGLTYTEVWRKL